MRRRQSPYSGQEGALGYRSRMSTGTPRPTLALASTAGPTNQEERQALASWARTLTYLGLGWHVLEAAVAIVAGVVAGRSHWLGSAPTA